MTSPDKAALAAIRPDMVREHIKPLEWESDGAGYWTATCPHTFLNYAVMTRSTGLTEWRGAFDFTDALSEEAGKQSAQADYASRITSAIDPAFIARIEALEAEADGWVMVPVEPTREMWAAMADTLYGYKNRHHDKVAGDLYRAMLAARPSPSEAVEARRLALEERVTDEMVEAAAKAHTPQFSAMDPTIQKYALEQMRSALNAALAVPARAAKPIQRSKRWASELSNDELIAEMAEVEAKIANGFGEHGGSPGEWYYERADEVDAEMKRRALIQKGKADE